MIIQTDDFRYERSGDLTYTSRSSYPQDPVDLFEKYNQEVTDKGSYSNSTSLTPKDWEILFLGSIYKYIAKK